MIKIKPDKEGFLTQWDSNRRLQITGLEDISNTEIHFSSPNDTKGAYVVLPVIENGITFADIPNILLTVSGRIDVFVFRDDHTCVRGVFVVAPREKPNDYVYTETEVWRYEKFVEQLNGKEDTANRVTTVDDSSDDEHYPTAGATYKAMPKKLSDLENDLFYNRKSVFVSLNQEDLIFNDDGTGMGYYSYQGEQPMAFLKSTSDIDYEIQYTYNGTEYCLTKTLTATYSNGEFVDYLYRVIINNSGDNYYIEFNNGDYSQVTGLKIIIYKVEQKQIGRDFIDDSSFSNIYVKEANGQNNLVSDIIVPRIDPKYKNYYGSKISLSDNTLWSSSQIEFYRIPITGYTGGVFEKDCSDDITLLEGIKLLKGNNTTKILLLFVEPNTGNLAESELGALIPIYRFHFEKSPIHGFVYYNSFGKKLDISFTYKLKRENDLITGFEKALLKFEEIS